MLLPAGIIGTEETDVNEGRHRLTLKTWEIGAKAVRRLPLRDLARPLARTGR